MKHPMTRAALGLLVIGALAHPASAQTTTDEPIRNEYRVTLVTTRPAADREKVILFQYLGIVDNNDKQLTSYYYSPPGLIIKPTKWVEIWAGMFGLYTDNKEANNSWEIRPLTGVKVYVPNNKKLNLFNFTRFEYRSIHQDGTSNGIPRLRNRVGVEGPFTQTNAWTPKTWYGLADAEPFWRLDDGYMERFRIRGGIGYILSRTWRAEFIYHAEFSSGKNEPKRYSDNIWRLNIKLSLPRRGERVSIVPDVDVDE
jgi:hypothetical protein